MLQTSRDAVRSYTAVLSEDGAPAVRSVWHHPHSSFAKSSNALANRKTFLASTSSSPMSDILSVRGLLPHEIDEAAEAAEGRERTGLFPLFTSLPDTPQSLLV